MKSLSIAVVKHGAPIVGDINGCLSPTASPKSEPLYRWRPSRDMSHEIGHPSINSDIVPMVIECHYEHPCHGEIALTGRVELRNLRVDEEFRDRGVGTAIGADGVTRTATETDEYLTKMLDKLRD